MPRTKSHSYSYWPHSRQQLWRSREQNSQPQRGSYSALKQNCRWWTQQAFNSVTSKRSIPLSAKANIWSRMCRDITQRKKRHISGSLSKHPPVSSSASCPYNLSGNLRAVPSATRKYLLSSASRAARCAAEGGRVGGGGVVTGGGETVQSEAALMRGGGMAANLARQSSSRARAERGDAALFNGDLKQQSERLWCDGIWTEISIDMRRAAGGGWFDWTAIKGIAGLTIWGDLNIYPPPPLKVSKNIRQFLKINVANDRGVAFRAPWSCTYCLAEKT